MDFVCWLPLCVQIYKVSVTKPTRVVPKRGTASAMIDWKKQARNMKEE